MEQVIRMKLKNLAAKVPRPRLRRQNTAVFAGACVLLLALFGALSGSNREANVGKKILGAATSGFENLENGDINGAVHNFEEIQSQLAGSNGVITGLLQIDAAQLSEVVDDVKAGLGELASARFAWSQESNSSDQNFFSHLKNSRAHLLAAQSKLAAASFHPKIRQARQILSEVARMEGTLLNLLGGKPKTYLLVFQNNNEARATGGFVGTYGILEFRSGTARIRKIESIYALDGQLKEKILAPSPVQRVVSKYWGLRDANWFADFPSTARKMLMFLEKESGILADGVISATPDVFEKLLALTGPVPMPEYGVVLTPENFRQAVQYKTSLDYDRVLNEPKKFLAEFAPRFLGKFAGLSEAGRFEALLVLQKAAAEKQLLAFSLDPEMQADFVYFDLEGAVKKTSGDYLGIFHSNVGGGKTDLAIGQKVEKQVTIDSAGRAYVRLQISRTHSGSDEKFFPKNVDFMRVLVPAGSRLLSASGFDDFVMPKFPAAGGEVLDEDLAAWEKALFHDRANGIYIGQEAGHTIFANFLELEPGQTKNVELVYELPFLADKSYSLAVQKQPGAAPFDFSLQINYGRGEIANYYPENLTLAANGVSIRESVNTDKFYAVTGK